VETLLQVMAASMLVIATLSVASMVSAYSSASGSATPRSFPLIAADDQSQNALSTFVGAFIFSIVALIALKNGYYQQGGFSALFALTMLVFTFVVLTFVRWVDGIARLGRLGNTIDKVEVATEQALEQRSANPTLGGRRFKGGDESGEPVVGDIIGYVQHIKMDVLQSYGEQADCKTYVTSLPGTFSVPGRPLAYVQGIDVDHALVRSAFIVGDDRTYVDDPRFGLVVLSEIAGRALSPAVNDPGTAIDIVGTFVRLFARYGQTDKLYDCRYDRVYVQETSVHDMFDDAFTAIARDGAGCVEVAVRLQKAFRALATLENQSIRDAARHHSQLALIRAEHSLRLAQEIEIVRAASIDGAD